MAELPIVEQTEHSVTVGRPYNEILPPEGDEDVGKRVFELLDEILQDKVNQGLHERWTRNYELGRNRHWRYKSTKVSLAQANLLYIHRQRTVNHLTDNNPTFDIKGYGNLQDEDQEKLSTILHTTEHWWNETEQQDIYADSCWNGETYGSAIEHERFNPDLEFGIGEVETLTLDPFYFGLWPVRTRDVQKAMASLWYQPIHIQEVKRLFPDFADEIRTDEDIIAELGEDRREIAEGQSTSKGILATVAGVVKKLLGTSKEGISDIDDLCLVVRCWVKDYSMVKTQRVSEIDGATMEEVEEPKYTGNIRMVTVLNAGQLVVEDLDNPSINPEIPKEEAQKCYLFDKFPFTKVNSLYETTAAWGPSDFEQLEQLNIELDKALSQFNTVKDRATRAKLINPKTSGVPNEHLTNYVGILNPTTANHGITWLQSNPISEADMLAINLFKELFFLVAGSFDLEQADTAGKDVLAYRAIAALLERAATMMRGKIRSYQKLVRERGRMYVSLMQNFYSTERWIAYREDGEEKQAPVVGKNLLIPAKISVVSGSTLPVSRIQQREEALVLYKMQAIDRDALLEKLDWSNRKEIINRMKLGPIGEFMQKLSFVLPQEVLQQIAQFAQADIKEIKRAAEQGKLQPIQFPKQGEAGGGMKDVMAQLALREKSLALDDKEADIKKKLAEIERIRAQNLFDSEKAVTERMRQRVMAEGVGLDKEKLKLDRAEVVDSLQDSDHSRKVGTLESASKHLKTTRGGEKPGKQGPYLEKGMKSNNEEPTQ